jgi:hypothetical protein
MDILSELPGENTYIQKGLEEEFQDSFFRKPLLDHDTLTEIA